MLDKGIGGFLAPIARLLSAGMLLGLLALVTRAVSSQGFVSLPATAVADAPLQLLTFDLSIALVLVVLWLRRDARSLGRRTLPFVVLTAAAGAIGPLLYLVLRPRGAALADGSFRLGRLARALLAATLAAFGAATLLVLDRHAYMGFVMAVMANETTQALFAHLVAALMLVAAWVVLDARAQRGGYVSFLVVGLLFGSAGPLAYLLTRHLPAARQRLIGLVLAIASVLAVDIGNRDPDLRNAEVRADRPDAERRGRELLAAMAERHGLPAFRRHATMQVTACDRWPGGSAWWPQDVQCFRSQSRLRTFSSRIELLDGPGKGEVWGIQSWAPYRGRSGQPPALLSEPDAAISFYLPTLHYFNELPFRILSAGIVRAAGEARLGGRTYDRVFATWGRPEPNGDNDQYVLWIDRETGLLSKVRYTVREATTRMSARQRRWLRSVILGTMHYEDYRSLDGVMMPFAQTVTLSPPELTRHPLSRHHFHRLELREAAFDTVPTEALILDPRRDEIGDRKPAPSALATTAGRGP